MLHSARELSDLIGAVYEAGLDPTGAQWPAVFERLSPVIAGGGAITLGLGRQRFGYAQIHKIGLDDASIALYRAYYGGVDPVFEPRLPSAPVGEVMLSDAIMPVRELRRTEFDADWSLPHGLGVVAAAVLVRHGSCDAGLYVVRPRHHGPFAPEDVAALGLLLPHVAAAVRVTLRLVEIGARESAAADALDHWRQAVLLVDGRGGVHAANRAAEALLRASDGLSLDADKGRGRGRLQGATPAATLALRRLVAAAAAVATPPATDRGAEPSVPPQQMAMALDRPSGRPALAALVVPLRAASGASGGWAALHVADTPRGTVAVFVTDPATSIGGDGDPVRARLRAAFRLTPAEAAVAVALASGDGLPAVGAAQGVTIATVRTQAQHVYRKTGVRGQAALARLVERLAHVR